MRMKYLQWLPVIGIFFVMYYDFSKKSSESIIYTHFWSSCFWHGIWLGMIVLTLMITK